MAHFSSFDFKRFNQVNDKRFAQVFREFHNVTTQLQEIRNILERSVVVQSEEKLPISCERDSSPSSPENLFTAKTPEMYCCDTPVWQSPKGKQIFRNTGTVKKMEVPLENRFSGLNVEEALPLEVPQPSNISQEIVPESIPIPVSFLPSRRPAVVTEECPERNCLPPTMKKRPARVPERSHLSPVTVPGNSSYASISRNGPKILCYGDSHFNRIKAREIRRCVPHTLPMVRPFTGATTKHMHHHVLPTLEDESPDAVLIHAGTNNITKELGYTAEQIAFEACEIGERCRQMGVNKIFISSVLTLRNSWWREIVRETNIILKGCASRGISFSSTMTT